MRHDARPGLSLEQIQVVAGLSSPKKGSQWLDPAVLKVAMCLQVFPEATWREINFAMPNARRELLIRGVFRFMHESADEARSTRSPVFRS